MMIKKKIQSLLIKEFTRFPKSEIQDYYKLLFQSVYGAGHMIQNYNDCLEMLEKEMLQIEPDTNCPLYYDISLNIPLVRVNLSRCKAEKIDHRKISNAFFAGTKVYKKNDTLEFGFETFLNIANTELIKFPFQIEEKELNSFTNRMKKLGFPAVHHSKKYKNHYNPHYRVIPLKMWEEEIS